MRALLLALLLTGATTAHAQSQDAPSPETIGRCLIVAKGHSYMLRPCKYRFHYSRLSGHTLSFEQKRPRNYYTRFGYIDFDDRTRTAGEGSWSGPIISSLHADHFVGKLRRRGACWSNKAARFCFWPAPAAR